MGREREATAGGGRGEEEGGGDAEGEGQGGQGHQAQEGDLGQKRGGQEVCRQVFCRALELKLSFWKTLSSSKLV